MKTLLIALVALASPALLADAHQENAEFGVWNWHLAKQLNLTDAQKQQIKAVRENQKINWKQDAASLITAEKALENAIATNPSDETSIHSLENQVANARAQVVIDQARLWAAIQPILTDDQKAQVSAWLAKRQAWMQKRIDRLNGSAASTDSNGS